MANPDMYSLIHSRYNAFTNTEKKVADYILANLADVIYMSITDLADACHVGEASVFRFCKSMDFKGYQEFKIVLAHSISVDNETPQLSNSVTLEDSLEELASKVLNSNVQALTETFHLLDQHTLEEATNCLVEANRIQFFGVGSSAITAMEAKNKFMRISNKTDFTLDSHLQIMSASLMGPDDVAIVISYSGSTKDMIEIAKVVKERRAKLILITRFSKSPLTSFSDYTLLCGANEGPLQGGSLTAKLAQLYLLDLLYFNYFRKTNEQSAANKEVTAKAVIEKML